MTTINPVAILVRAGWKFSAYQSPDTWQVWAKHPLGGACMVAELTRIGRTGFDVKATAEYVAEILNQIEEVPIPGPTEFIPHRPHSIHCSAHNGVGVPFDDERCDCGATSIAGRTVTE